MCDLAATIVALSHLLVVSPRLTYSHDSHDSKLIKRVCHDMVMISVGWEAMSWDFMATCELEVNT